MNKDFVLFHLTEAEKAIHDIIADIRADRKYEYGNFRVDMEHIYTHVNSAWNAREASEDAARACSQKDFDRWRQFPTDIQLASE